MNRDDITNVYYNGTEVTSLHWGGNLIYEKNVEPESGDITGFYDESGVSDYLCNPYLTINGTSYKYEVYPSGNFYYNVEVPKVTSLENLCSYKVQKSSTSYTTSHNHALRKIDITNLNFDYVTNINSMFDGCMNLTEVIGLNTKDYSNIHKFDSIFNGCENITDIDFGNSTLQTDTTSGGSSSGMFYDCHNLVNLHINYVKLNKTKYYDFYGCNQLVNVTGSWINNDNDDFSLMYCRALSNDSAMLFVDGLPSTDKERKITFYRNVYDTLTEEQMAMATSKGWTVVRY